VPSFATKSTSNLPLGAEMQQCGQNSKIKTIKHENKKVEKSKARKLEWQKKG